MQEATFGTAVKTSIKTKGVIMDLIAKIDKEEVKELFSKNWLTHDAIWYGTCVQEMGQEKANEINKVAARTMATMEMGRILKLMGMPKDPSVQTFDELKEIVDTAMSAVKAKFMIFDYGFPEKNVLRGKYNRCFAFDGLSRFNLTEKYECGIIERIKGWLDHLKVSYEVVPDFKGCLMASEGKCEIDFRFDLA